MESCVFQKFLSQQKPPKKQHEEAVTESLESGLSAAGAMQQKVEKEKCRGQVEEEEEVVVVVKGDVGCPGLPPPYSITLCQQLCTATFCTLFLEWGIEAIARP